MSMGAARQASPKDVTSSKIRLPRKFTLFVNHIHASSIPGFQRHYRISRSDVPVPVERCMGTDHSPGEIQRLKIGGVSFDAHTMLFNSF